MIYTKGHITVYFWGISDFDKKKSIGNSVN